MSLRELRVLVTNLPPDSATTRAVRGHNWGDIEYMLAEILDVVKYHRVEWAMSKGAKPPKPKPAARPKVAERRTGAGTDTDGQQVRPLGDRDLARVAHRHVIEQVGLDRAPESSIVEGG